MLLSEVDGPILGLGEVDYSQGLPTAGIGELRIPEEIRGLGQTAEQSISGLQVSGAIWLALGIAYDVTRLGAVKSQALRRILAGGEGAAGLAAAYFGGRIALDMDVDRTSRWIAAIASGVMVLWGAADVYQALLAPKPKVTSFTQKLKTVTKVVAGQA